MGPHPMRGHYCPPRAGHLCPHPGYPAGRTDLSLLSHGPGCPCFSGTRGLTSLCQLGKGEAPLLQKPKALLAHPSLCRKEVRTGVSLQRYVSSWLCVHGKQLLRPCPINAGERGCGRMKRVKGAKCRVTEGDETSPCPSRAGSTHCISRCPLVTSCTGHLYNVSSQCHPNTWN